MGLRHETDAASDHRVLSVDFPGHGESGRPKEPWGVKEYAESLKELLQRLDFLPCSVVAHSFGARVAAWLEAEEGGFFEKIVFTAFDMTVYHISVF